MLKKTSLIKPQMLLAQSLVLLTLGVMILVRPEMVNAMLSALLAVALIANAVVSLMILFGDRFGRFHSEAPFDHDGRYAVAYAYTPQLANIPDVFAQAAAYAAYH